MKKLLALALVCLMVVSLTVPTLALGEEMIVKRAKITVDGKIDSAWAYADRQELGYIKNKVAKPTDSSAFVSALWNDNTIYFLFEITDNDPSFNSTAGDWKNDGIYLYLEELGIGGKVFAEGQYQFALIPKDGFSQVPRRGDAAAMGAFEYAYTETANGYVIEASYTFVKTELSAGKEIKADFQYNDCNAKKERTHNFGWSDETDAAVSDGNVWGTLKLSLQKAKAPAGKPVDKVKEEAAAEEERGLDPFVEVDWYTDKDWYTDVDWYTDADWFTELDPWFN